MKEYVYFTMMQPDFQFDSAIKYPCSDNWHTVKVQEIIW